MAAARKGRRVLFLVNHEAQVRGTLDRLAQMVAQLDPAGAVITTDVFHAPDHLDPVSIKYRAVTIGPGMIYVDSVANGARHVGLGLTDVEFDHHARDEVEASLERRVQAARNELATFRRSPGAWFSQRS